MYYNKSDFPTRNNTKPIPKCISKQFVFLHSCFLEVVRWPVYLLIYSFFYFIRVIYFLFMYTWLFITINLSKNPQIWHAPPFGKKSIFTWSLGTSSSSTHGSWHAKCLAFSVLKVLMTFQTLPPPIFISTFWKIKIINWGTKRSLIIKLSCLKLWKFYHPHEFVSVVLQTCVAVLWVVWTLLTRNKIKIKYKFIVTSQVLAFSCDNLSFKSISVKVIQKYHFNYMLSYRHNNE